MNKYEKELFVSLCNFKDLDKSKLKKLLRDYSTPEVLGTLFFNRMQGIAYGVLAKEELLNELNREFRNSLRSAYEQNIIKNNSFTECLKYLSFVLPDCSYAMLKGAVLCKKYPDGYRTANDIDILTLPEDVTVIGEALISNGFSQGYIKNGEFIPATRREIVESKMMRGETVPYIKEMNLPGFKYLEADINFSLDYKNGDNFVLKEMLESATDISSGDFKIRTLNKIDFFLHLCEHLYKEAATMSWVEMKRDMTLYKYCDIYMLISEMTDTDIENLFSRAKELGIEGRLGYAILQTSELFKIENKKIVETAENILDKNSDFLHTVIAPLEKKSYIYIERDIKKRFFANDRKKLLREVII